jgi:hypothetical protein
VSAAAGFGISHSSSFQTLFENDALPALSDADAYRLKIADQALTQVVPDLLKEANARVAKAGVVSSTDAEVAKVVKRIRQVVPAEGCRTMADILNGAWIASEDPDLWKQFPAVRTKKLSALKELVLKNLEIFEIEQIQAQP